MTDLMTDWQAYKDLPSKLIGKTEKEAADLITASGGPFVVARRDLKSEIVSMQVQIWLNVYNGIVIGTKLDGADYGQW